MRRYTDFIYRNAKDTIRIRIWKRTDEAGHFVGWDYDFVGRKTLIKCQSTDSADLFERKKDALEAATRAFGPLTSIQPEFLTEGWN